MTRIAEFAISDDAYLFWQAKGKRTHAICAGTHLPWAVRARTDFEMSIDEEVTARVREHDQYLARGWAP